MRARILIVDDDPDWRDYLHDWTSQALQGIPCDSEIEVVSNKEKARDAIDRQGSWHLLIADLALTGQDDLTHGMVLIERARNAGIPTVAISGHPAVTLQDVSNLFVKYKIEDFFDKLPNLAGPDFIMRVRECLIRSLRPPVWTCKPDRYIELGKHVSESGYFIRKVTRDARAELRRLTKYGAFAAAHASGKSEIRAKMVEALYLHLKNDYDLRYEYEEAFDEGTGAQNIRKPSLIGKERRGTCLDLTLMFLGCLANVRLWPIYIQVKFDGSDHAIGGTWLIDPAETRPTLIEPSELLRHIRSKDILIFDCTGFVEEYLPRNRYKCSFKEACKQTLSMVKAHNVRFALDINPAKKTV